mmetsp:Transcript_17404/g.31364  ORF Transcript_17404/g.31364 Transcript_17404/m.31364 type:complete len:130 (-) Transcript_17404:81-470(-)
MAWTLKVNQAISGEALCELDLEPNATVWQVREYIEQKTGIPRHVQRLLIGSEECCRKSDILLDQLAGRDQEVQLVVRHYARQEMQAAFLIEGWWTRRKGQEEADEENEEGQAEEDEQGRAAAVEDADPR